MTTDRTVALVRQAIFHVLDESNPRTPGLAWDFNDDEQRVDFADRVVEWLVQKEPRPCRQLDASLVEFSEMFKREGV
jgi:hypothetical protein